MAAPDPVALTQRLIRCASVTPEDDGALAIVAAELAAAGFRCTRIERGGVSNLYARWGDAGPVLGFAGHTDVVPTGDPTRWSAPPFGAEIRDGEIIGRGSVDMKSGVAAMVAAGVDAVADGAIPGSLAFLITGDEEGDAVDGTMAILDWMREAGETLDACVVGEPTSRERFGDAVKIGRRGSLNAVIRSEGRQGHSAYPQRAANPLPPLIRMLDRLAAATLDDGSDHFEPSTLAVTSVDVGNPATNVIPAAGEARLNIRFNDRQTSDGLTAWLEQEAAAAASTSDVTVAVAVKVSAEPFATRPGRLSAAAEAAIAEETGTGPSLETGGGTSDARFIQAICPVIEVGLVGRGMHAVDERVPVDEIERLTRVYRRLVDRYFGD